MTDVKSTSTHNYQIINTVTIEYGATPDRHSSNLLLKCVSLATHIEDSGEGRVFDYSAPVRIEVYCRDIRATAKREEPQQLVRMQKKLIEFLNLNKHSMMDEGVSHITVKDVSMVEVDKEEFGLSNWYKLNITVSLQYRLKSVAQ